MTDGELVFTYFMVCVLLVALVQALRPLLTFGLLLILGVGGFVAIIWGLGVEKLFQ